MDKDNCFPFTKKSGAPNPSKAVPSTLVITSPFSGLRPFFYVILFLPLQDF